MKMKKHSAFTLIEMIIVLAIIAILTTVLIPTMSGYMTRSRLNTANSNAKVLFNSLQTIMQEYEFSERNTPDSLFYGNTAGGAIYLCGENGLITENKAVDATGTESVIADDVIGADWDTAGAATLGARLDRLFADYREVAWVAYVENYSVRGVVCATSMNTDYIGGYPLKATERGQLAGVSYDDLEVLADLATSPCPVKLYADRAWSVTPVVTTTTN